MAFLAVAPAGVEAEVDAASSVMSTFDGERQPEPQQLEPMERVAEATVAQKEHAEKGAVKLSHLEYREMMDNLQCHEVVRQVANKFYEWDVEQDGSWMLRTPLPRPPPPPPPPPLPSRLPAPPPPRLRPSSSSPSLRQSRDIMNMWMKTVENKRSPMFSAEIYPCGLHPDFPEDVVSPPRTANYIESILLMSSQTLFFEGVRRYLMGGNEFTRQKVELFIACGGTEEAMSSIPLKLITPELRALVSMNRASVEKAEGPHLTIIGTLKWLANEIYTVHEPNHSAIAAAAAAEFNRKYLELFPPETAEAAEAAEGADDMEV